MQYLTVLGFTPQVILILVLAVLYQYVTGLKWEAVMLLFASFGATTLGTLIKLVAEQGILKEPLPEPSKYTDQSYLNQALAEIGRK